MYSRMSRGQRYVTYTVCGVLWLSGCCWLVLDKYFMVRGPFGRQPHRWAAPVLLLHGVAAIASMYFLGWMTARHVMTWWPQRLRRLSGGTLAACLALLALSGFALFFLSDDSLQHASVLIHDVVGLGVTVVGVQHGFFARRGAMPP